MLTGPIGKLLVANRGEIAARIMRTAHALGIATVAVYSDPDADAPYVTQADEAVRLPGAAPADTYLRGDLIVAAAAATGADAVHPGYGFLSENAAFARACVRAGLIFVGPPPVTIAAMGSKIEAKALMAAAGVPVLPGVTVTDPDDADLAGAAAQVGFPLLVKAAFGGGGRGMRLVRDPAELADAVRGASGEAASAFGDGTVFLERFVVDPRHVEVQILGDIEGTVVHLFERECSIQRRYQKIVEECPSPAVDSGLRAALTAAAVAAGRAIGYVGAGTVEFVLDRDGSFFFLEVNTRLQVEHPVTEEVTGLDLVEWQLRIAQGEPLPPEVTGAAIAGHAIEARLYAEDVAAGFLPVTGVLHRFAIPAAPGVRVEAGFGDGSVVSPHYDAMLAKVIAHGRTRADAARRLARALRGRRDPRRRHQPRPAGGHPARAGLPGRRHRHRLPDPPRPRRPRRSAVGGHGAARPGRGAGPAGGQPGARPRSSAISRPAGATSGPRRSASPTPPRGRRTPSRTACPDPGSKPSGPPSTTRRWGRPSSSTRPPENRVDLEVDGTRRVYRVHRVGAVTYVDASNGSSALTEAPRFGDADDAGPAGSLLAPMPGVVRRVLAEVGTVVTAGQPLLVLEAMKMEQTVAAPADGVVAELRAKAGEQVSGGQILAVLDPAPTPEDARAAPPTPAPEDGR